MHQQDQMQNISPNNPRGGVGIALTGLVAFALGHVSPLRSNGKKNQKELERLYQIISSKNVEVQKLKTMVYEYEYRNQELKQALYESEQESLKRDYEEFKQPDANGDDVISRAEVSRDIEHLCSKF
jgi:predicted RNase H-like nuclease (RuvC/YqgF family)